MATLQTIEGQVARRAAVTSPFYDTVRNRASDDAEFRASLLAVTTEAFASGDLEESKAAVRTYIKSTIGYQQMADFIGLHPKSLIRMLGPDGNPRASSLASLLAQSLEIEGVSLEVRANIVSD